MLELCASGQLETISLEFAFQAKFERRLGFRDLSHLSQIGQTAIGSGQGRAAVGANENNRRAGLELDRPGAGRTIGGEYCYTSPPAAVLFKSRISDLKFLVSALPRSSFVTLTKPAPNEAFKLASQSHSGRVRQQ